MPDPPELLAHPPLLIVLSGTSGAGKDSVRDLLVEWYPHMHRVVTATTRPIRHGEVEGRDYHFLTDTEFDEVLEDGGFVEHAVVYGRRYGVPRIEIENPLSSGCDAVARVDIQGAATIKTMVPDAVLIFVTPGSVEETARRMKSRDTDSEADRRRREELAVNELAAASDFDHIVLNETGKLEETTRAVAAIIAAEKRSRAGRLAP